MKADRPSTLLGLRETEARLREACCDIVALDLDLDLHLRQIAEVVLDARQRAVEQQKRAERLAQARRAEP